MIKSDKRNNDPWIIMSSSWSRKFQVYIEHCQVNIALVFLTVLVQELYFLGEISPKRFRKTVKHIFVWFMHPSHSRNVQTMGMQKYIPTTWAIPNLPFYANKKTRDDVTCHINWYVSIPWIPNQDQSEKSSNLLASSHSMCKWALLNSMNSGEFLFYWGTPEFIHLIDGIFPFTKKPSSELGVYPYDIPWHQWRTAPAPHPWRFGQSPGRFGRCIYAHRGIGADMCTSYILAKGACLHVSHTGFGIYTHSICICCMMCIQNATNMCISLIVQLHLANKIEIHWPENRLFP